MSEQKQSKTPWITRKAPSGPVDIFDAEDRDILTLYGGGTDGYAEANAAHIVKCVNCHDDLLEALKGLMAWADGPRSDALADLEKARKAIASAEGEQQ